MLEMIGQAAVSFCVCEDGNCDYCLCKTKLEKAAKKKKHSCYSDRTLLFWFCCSGSLIKIGRRVQRSATLLIVKIPSVGGGLIISF